MMTVNSETETRLPQRGRWCVRLAVALIAGFASGCLTNATAQPPVVHQVKAKASTSEYEVLAAYTWVLEQASDAQGAEQALWVLPDGKPITVWFSKAGGPAWFGSRACNYMSWPISLLSKNQLKTGVSSVTAMGCDETLMKLENRLYQQLGQTRSYQLLSKPNSVSKASPQLLLGFADGSRWTLRGEPTPRTKYGSDGELVLYEVAPDHQRCTNAAQDERLCLRMRRVQWGVRDGKGYFFGHKAWELFPVNTFAPWSHTIGWHGVLETRRYPLPGNGNKGRQYDYLEVKEYTRFW